MSLFTPAPARDTKSPAVPKRGPFKWGDFLLGAGAFLVKEITIKEASMNDEGVPDS